MIHTKLFCDMVDQRSINIDTEIISSSSLVLYASFGFEPNCTICYRRRIQTDWKLILHRRLYIYIYIRFNKNILSTKRLPRYDLDRSPSSFGKSLSSRRNGSYTLCVEQLFYFGNRKCPVLIASTVSRNGQKMRLVIFMTIHLITI